MHDDRLLREPDDLEGRETKRRDHGEEHEDGQDDFCGGVTVRQLPQAEDAHLGEADQSLQESVTAHHKEQRHKRTNLKRIPLKTILQPLRKSWNLSLFIHPFLAASSQTPLKAATRPSTTTTKKTK